MNLTEIVPYELWVHIFNEFTPRTLLPFSLVNRRWNLITNDSYLWKLFCIKEKFFIPEDFNGHHKNFYKHYFSAQCFLENIYNHKIKCCFRRVLIDNQIISCVEKNGNLDITCAERKWEFEPSTHQLKPKLDDSMEIEEELRESKNELQSSEFDDRELQKIEERLLKRYFVHYLPQKALPIHIVRSRSYFAVLFRKATKDTTNDYLKVFPFSSLEKKEKKLSEVYHKRFKNNESVKSFIFYKGNLLFVTSNGHLSIVNLLVCKIFTKTILDLDMPLKTSDLFICQGVLLMKISGNKDELLLIDFSLTSKQMIRRAGFDLRMTSDSTWFYKSLCTFPLMEQKIFYFYLVMASSPPLKKSEYIPIPDRFSFNEIWEDTSLEEKVKAATYFCDHDAEARYRKGRGKLLDRYLRVNKPPIKRARLS